MQKLSELIYAFGAGAIALGVLSWTESVSLFRLEIAAPYEHMIAYGALVMMIMTAKRSMWLGLSDLILLVSLAAGMEALKAFVPFRHPKVMDFYADLFGASLAMAAGIVIAIILKGIMKQITQLTMR